MQIARTADEINEARLRAQKAAFAADDAGETDDAASAVYDVLQWVLGDLGDDPTIEMAEDDDEDEDDPEA
jgi:hypothetical protein